MKALWLKLARRFAALSQREKLLVAGLLALGLPGAIIGIWVEPTWRTQKVLKADLVRIQEEAAKQPSPIITVDPNPQARAELEALEARLASAEQDFAEQAKGLGQPGEMVNLLEKLLARHPGVRLNALRSLPSALLQPAGTPGASQASPPASAAPTQPANPAAAASGANPPASGQAAATQTIAIYRHGIELELEGGWGALRSYLAEIERIPRPLQWGQLKLTAQTYPQVRMTVSLYTLSLESAWLQL
jgi:MSHA biogenesis protein MshJ